MSKFLLPLLLIVLSIMVFIPFVYFFFRMGYSIEINYNEGWNVVHAVNVFSGKPLYTPSLTPVNYPPIFFFLIALCMRTIKEPLLIGRVISFVSVLSICFLVGKILHVYKATITEITFSCLLLLVFFSLFTPNYIGMNDPQLLGQAILLIGYVLYISGAVSIKKLFITSLLFITALLIKQNIIALPLAISMQIFLFHRRYFLFWVMFLIFLGVGSIIGLQVYSHGMFLPSIVFIRRYDSVYALQKVLPFLLAAIVQLGTVLLIVVKFHKEIWNHKYALVYLYLAFSILLNIFFSGGFGTNFNTFFDSFIALAIAFGISLVKLRLQGNILIHKIVLTYSSFYLLIFGLFVVTLTPFLTLSQQENITAQTVKILQQYHGPVFCSDILFCYFAGKPFVLDPFLSEEMVMQGIVDKNRVVSMFKNHYFVAVELNKNINNTNDVGIEETAYRKNFEKTIKDNYRLLQQNGSLSFYAIN